MSGAHVEHAVVEGREDHDRAEGIWSATERNELRAEEAQRPKLASVVLMRPWYFVGRASRCSELDEKNARSSTGSMSRSLPANAGRRDDIAKSPPAIRITIETKTMKPPGEELRSALHPKTREAGRVALCRNFFSTCSGGSERSAFSGSARPLAFGQPSASLRARPRRTADSPPANGYGSRHTCRTRGALRPA